jgi:uncharacterized phiE125 gp8 family phage protein
MQNYNLIIDVKDIEAGSPSNSEPVSLTEMKAYMRLESFEDDLGSTSNLTYTTDDALIEELITAAREKCETYKGESFIPKELRVTLTNLAGLIELPYGPIGDVTAIYWGSDFEEDGEAATNNVADLVLTGSFFKYIVSPCDERMVIDYSCGYNRGDTMRLPRRYKIAIMEEVLYRYEHRGDEDQVTGVCKTARELLGRPRNWIIT